MDQAVEQITLCPFDVEGSIIIFLHYNLLYFIVEDIESKCFERSL